MGGRHYLSPVTFRLPLEMKQALRQHAEALGLDYSALVRAIVSRWLHEQSVRKFTTRDQPRAYTGASEANETGD